MASDPMMNKTRRVDGVSISAFAGGVEWGKQSTTKETNGRDNTDC